MPLSLNTRFWKKLTLSKLHRPNDGIGSRSTSATSTTSSHCSNSGKSVRFSDSCISVYYTYGSNDYKRGSLDNDDLDLEHQLKLNNDSNISNELDSDLLILSTADTDYFSNTNDSTSSDYYDSMDVKTQQDMAWDEQVRRNTKVNMKRGYHSVAVLIQYRSNR
ncbi:hypothetical protein BC941DRAFT_446965 [Chlamydoabsidia padenii]|nr:hypothetical protein BC941DRAFT_446965 [Chlamydoabsidia padenii]